jgi:hypothetical protein
VVLETEHEALRVYDVTKLCSLRHVEEEGQDSLSFLGSWTVELDVPGRHSVFERIRAVRLSHHMITSGNRIPRESDYANNSTGRARDEEVR